MCKPAHTCFCRWSSCKGRAVAVHGSRCCLGGHVAHHGPFGKVAIEDSGAEEPDEVEHVIVNGDVGRAWWEECVQEKETCAGCWGHVW